MNGVVLNFDGVKNIVQDYDYNMIENDIYRAHQMLINRNGPGNNFLGWLDLPENRDEEDKKTSGCFCSSWNRWILLGSKSGYRFIYRSVI